MHYLITGHTGFKGSWLTLLLTESGHSVSGLSLDPEPESLFVRAGLAERLTFDFRTDVRSASATMQAVQRASPDVIVHLAAQPLVRESYRDPRFTIETNVNGTLNVLEAAGATPSVGTHLVVTTDKVYRNLDRLEGYEEDEPLGGDDPYSASKAMVELLVNAWTHSFPGPSTVVARAGNVIGGGDASPDRLLPDILRSFAAGQPVTLRYPHAVRPWQHVLDCLNGYRLLLDAAVDRRAHGAWNFGPGDGSFATVSDIATRAAEIWGDGASVMYANLNEPHEAGRLTLNSNKAREALGWQDRLSLNEALEWTIDWERQVRGGRDPLAVCLEQIGSFRSLP